VGGEDKSAHLLGAAVDISCGTSWQRAIMIKALLRAGFRRIGIKPHVLHTDILPGEAIFLY
jgi:hypothetical protein